MATATTRKRPRGASTTRKHATRGSMRNPAKGVVDLRLGTEKSARPNAKKPYYATWYDAVNKRKGGSQAFETLPEASQWVQDQERDNMAAYGLGDSGRVKSRAFGEVAEAWTRTLTKAHNTVLGYKRQAAQLVAHFGHDRPIGSIDKHDVQGMIHDALKVKGLSNGTVRGRINVLNQIMEYAMDARPRLITDNPCRGVVRPKEQERDAWIFSGEELAAILAYLPEHMRAPVLIAYYAGLRIGECLGLSKRSLDLKRGRVKINRVRHSDSTVQEHTKSGKGVEWADLPEAILPMLRMLIAKYPPLEDGSLFSHKDRRDIVRALSQSTLRRHFKKACQAAGLPIKQLRFHDLRHTCATNYAEAGAPAYVIQALLRHARLDTSQRYIDKVSDEQRRNWANRVGGANSDAAGWAPPQPVAA